jgi:hypothetical protein
VLERFAGIWMPGFSRHENVSTCNILYKFYISNVIGKKNIAAINCITVQHIKFIPISSEESYYASMDYISNFMQR